MKGSVCIGGGVEFPSFSNSEYTYELRFFSGYHKIEITAKSIIIVSF